MTKRFTAIVPQEILSALGWSNPTTYAEVFDYLAHKGMLISISRYYDFGNECFGDGYDWSVDCENTLRSVAAGYADTWTEAANQAIIACLDLKDKYKTKEL